MGTTVRHTSSAGPVCGATKGTGLVTRASSTVSTNDEEDGVDSSRSDDAQQRSASAWLRTRCAPCSSESDLCIGHGPSPVQHAIRASGVASQPSHTAAAFPATRPRHRRTVETRCAKATTSRMLDQHRACQTKTNRHTGQREGHSRVPTHTEWRSKVDAQARHSPRRSRVVERRVIRYRGRAGRHP